MMESKQSAEMLKQAAKISLLTGPFLMLLGTGIIWAGTEDFGTSPWPWMLGLMYCGMLVVVIPALYVLHSKQELLWVKGLLGLLCAVPMLTVFGAGEFFFYFGLAPMPRWASMFGLIGGAALMIHWGYKVAGDVMEALHKKGLLAQAYIDAGDVYHYDAWSFMQRMDDVQRKRDPFKSYHLWMALALTPFTLVLNRILTPYTGSGHGVFIVLSILGLPMSLWIIGMAVRAYIVMIHYPLKLQRQTGKPVLMRDGG